MAVYSNESEKKKNESHSSKSSGESDVVQGKLSFNDNREESKRVTQLQENKTGLPDALKGGIESLSGVDISDTKVHYNSSKPKEVNAHAYAKGNEIHVAAGQEKHLAHEAWHVVQQKQGRVKPTTSVNGAAVNNDQSLEKEADVMGAKALQTKAVGGEFGFGTVASKILQLRKKPQAEEQKEAPVKEEPSKENATEDHPLIHMKKALGSSDYKTLLATKKDDPKAKEDMSMSDKLKAAMQEKKEEAGSKANRASRVAKDKAKKTAKTVKGLMEKFKKAFSSGEKDLEKIESKDKPASEPTDKLATAKTALSTTKTIISGIKSIADQLKTHSTVMKAVSEVPGVGAVISGISLAVGSIEVYETYQEQKSQEIAMQEKYAGKKIMFGYPGHSPEQVEEKIQSNAARTDNPVTKKKYLDRIASLKEYILDGELLVIAKKRFKRKVFEASVMFVDFIGRIAELFPGVGTLIGKIMSGVSSVMSAGAAAVRGIKQFGRDHGVAGFDHSKTTSAKQNKVVSLTGTMLNMVMNLPPYNQENAGSYTKVENYFRKAGCDMGEIYLHTGHTSEQIDYIIESLKKRS